MIRIPSAALLGLLLLLLPVAAAPAVAAPKTPPPLDATTRDFHQCHLDIYVRPDMEKGTIKGRVRLRFEALNDDLRSLRLHCVDTLIASVRDAQGEDLPFKVQKGILTIQLPAPLARGAEGMVEIAYTCRPKRGLFFHSPDKRWPTRPLLLYSQGQGTENRRWIPCYDEPDDRTSWDLHVTRPKDLTSVSNGVLVGTTSNGQACVDHWKFDGRSPTYLISLIVGPLQTIREKWRNVQLDFSAVPGHEEALRTSLAETANMLEFLSNYLQSPYPRPS